MKLFTCNSNIKHILIVLIVLFLSHESNGKKSQYGELLTDDNELFLIEQPAPAAKPKPAQQPHLVVRRSAEAATTHNSSSSSSTHKKSKPSKTVTKTKKAVTKKSKPKTPKTTASKPIDKNKLIVKIIYASSNNPARSDLTKLVYSTSESLSPCDKNLCKSNEVRFKRPDSNNPDILPNHIIFIRYASYWSKEQLQVKIINVCPNRNSQLCRGQTSPRKAHQNRDDIDAA